jgi:hypothetical protein
MTGNEANPGVSIRVAYNSKAIFGPDSTQPPPKTTLDLFLGQAFAGENLQRYVAKVQTTLPPDNVFRETSTVTFVASQMSEEKPELQSSGKKADVGVMVAGLAAGVTVCVLLLVIGGIALYRRKKRRALFSPIDEGPIFAMDRRIASFSLGSSSSSHSSWALSQGRRSDEEGK